MFINWGCLIFFFICDIDPQLDTSVSKNPACWEGAKGGIVIFAPDGLLPSIQCGKTMREILWELANKNVDLIWLVVDHPSEKSWSESQLALLFPIYGKS